MWYRRKKEGTWYDWQPILDSASGIQSATPSKEMMQRFRSGTVGVNAGAEVSVVYTYAHSYVVPPDVTHSLYTEGAYNDIDTVVSKITTTQATVKIKNNSSTVKYFMVMFMAVGNV
jgi:hypothetical protein